LPRHSFYYRENDQKITFKEVHDATYLPLVPVVSAPLALVGYKPPAGEPKVDEGEVLVKHELLGYIPCATV
jgi:hypothetical protein